MQEEQHNVCQQCGKSFSTAEHLEHHTQQEHASE